MSTGDDYSEFWRREFHGQTFNPFICINCKLGIQRNFVYYSYNLPLVNYCSYCFDDKYIVLNNYYLEKPKKAGNNPVMSVENIVCTKKLKPSTKTKSANKLV